MVNRIIDELRQHIAATYVRGETSDALTLDTPLISSGILDSLSALEVIAFLEQRLNVEFEAHEVDRARLDTLRGIADIVRDKVGH